MNRQYINKYLYRYQLNVKHRQTQLLMLHVSVLKGLMIAPSGAETCGVFRNRNFLYQKLVVVFGGVFFFHSVEETDTGKHFFFMQLVVAIALPPPPSQPKKNFVIQH